MAQAAMWPASLRASASGATELIDRSDLASPADARAAVFEDIEVSYNRVRRHSGIEHLG
jgi:hypothetical protein